MWADITAWFQSPGGARVLQTAIVPALAILVAGVLAALIARSATRGVLRRADREQAATAVAGLVEAARAAADGDGSRGDRRRAARLRTEADVRVRLLGLPGAERAADWAAARTAALGDRPDAAAQVAELRDALVAWVAAPRRARRLFAQTASSAPVDLTPLAADEPEPRWRRTESAQRLQQEHDRRTADEAPREDTAPVRVPHTTHRAEPAPIDEADQLDRVGPRQTSQSARPRSDDSEPTASAAKKPEWLDDYDDEAYVTQTMNLKTPPPVSASAVRDRAPSGDIVPRP